MLLYSIPAPGRHCFSPLLESCSFTGQPTKCPSRYLCTWFLECRARCILIYRVFYPNASSNHSTITSAAYRKHETTNKREYAQRIREVEHGIFTPLVFSTTEGMGREVATFYKRLAENIASKVGKNFPTVIGWLRCRLSFAILRSAILCI